jgi:hypothetical protein
VASAHPFILPDNPGGICRYGAKPAVFRRVLRGHLPLPLFPEIPALLSLIAETEGKTTAITGKNGILAGCFVLQN